MMGVSGRKMRCKLKGKMAHSTVVLPKATGYAGPVGPDLLRRLLGKRRVFLRFHATYHSVPLPLSTIYTLTSKINLEETCTQQIC